MYQLTGTSSRRTVVRRRTGNVIARRAQRRRRSAARLLVAVSLVGGMLFAPAAAHAQDRPDLAGRFVDSVNAERVQRGLPRLQVARDLSVAARAHSVVMANLNQLHHNPALATDVTNWLRVSENVGRGRSVSSLHTAFMNSEGHRRNILDTKVTQIGVGVEVREGTVWVTKVFRNPTALATTASVGGFRDVSSSSSHAANIRRIALSGVATGCTADRFCPADQVTREQMATFLGRAKGVLTADSGPFGDVSATGTHTGNVFGTAAAGIAVGCSNTGYCPSRALTRAEMAGFLGRALDLTPTPVSDFGDVAANDPDAGWIQAIADAGITGGCGGGDYCPDAPVSRQQMASFLVRAFGL
ncbi:MAG TPA: S-layer homology domain-containing protein [Egicoccus sp.]|nr:S-layer homology domain-containing protein [Egicoccus sp.]HSK23154.1 S-layer homology domain-containing protein [Egicoccus sp.]